MTMDWPKDFKRTKQRVLVLDVLKEAQEPVTAADISALLEKRGEGVWLSTIYRVLDAFTEAGIASKIDGLGGNMALYELHTHQHRHYAVCLRCKKIIPMRSCPLEHMAPQLLDEDFRVLGHKLQMYGHCAKCAK